MTYFSKYRSSGMSANRKALICVSVVLFLWCWVQDMDYQEQAQIHCEA